MTGATGGSPEPAGIYVHLPYCRSRCEYCAFVVTTDESSRTAYLEALGREADLAASEAGGEPFDSIYLGGGTPSLLPPDDLARLLDRLSDRFVLLPAAEVTMEANPDDVSEDLVDRWVGAGITRFSTGVQSLADAELAAVGRRHDADAARAAVGALTRTGLSVSADLILGLPEQTRETFLASADELADSGVDHLSIYLLETEKSRSIEADRRSRPERYLSDDDQADVWMDLSSRLSEAGFEHYEISNWARPGREARHNRKYWRRVPTIGLGVSSHEFWAGRRRANVSALPSYIASLGRGERPTAVDRALSRDEQDREAIVLGLRLREGVAEADLLRVIAMGEDPLLSTDYGRWTESGILERTESARVRFSERGFLLSNDVLCRFV